MLNGNNDVKIKGTLYTELTKSITLTFDTIASVKRAYVSSELKAIGNADLFPLTIPVFSMLPIVIDNPYFVA